MALEGLTSMASSLVPRPMDERTRIPRSGKMRDASRAHVVLRRQREREKAWWFFRTRIGSACLPNISAARDGILRKRKKYRGEMCIRVIAVYGNKGSTDQHSYVQQLRDGVLKFLCNVCGSAQRSAGARFEVRGWHHERRLSSWFFAWHARRLYEKGRESITMSIPR